MATTRCSREAEFHIISSRRKYMIRIYNEKVMITMGAYHESIWLRIRRLIGEVERNEQREPAAQRLNQLSTLAGHSLQRPMS